MLLVDLLFLDPCLCRSKWTWNQIFAGSDSKVLKCQRRKHYLPGLSEWESLLAYLLVLCCSIPSFIALKLDFYLCVISLEWFLSWIEQLFYLCCAGSQWWSDLGSYLSKAELLLVLFSVRGYSTGIRTPILVINFELEIKVSSGSFY